MPGAWRNWAVVLLLSAGVIVAYVDRTNISVAIADPEFTQAFGLDDVRRGVLNSAFFWSHALLQIPAGWLADRVRVKRLYADAFVLWSMVSAATGLVTSFTMLLLLPVLLGVAESIVTPASLRWIRDHIEEQHRGLAIGVFHSGTKIGSTIGTPLAAVFLSSFGWRGMFAVLGLASLAWLIPWLSIVPEERPAERSGTAAFAWACLNFCMSARCLRCWQAHSAKVTSLISVSPGSRCTSRSARD
jgi:MFS transporter, ACS family, D-galactonate transporter